ncbi:MAG: hypothetical protein LAQ69_27370 [Acidobacteriia bacterium]|nr:hypothetical protein [Terriglobia bacterium]
MRSARIWLLLISALTARAALGQPAQNSDISFLLGPVTGTAQAIAGSNASVSVSGAVNLQFGFAHTIHSYSFADLWLEWPVALAYGGNADVGRGVSAAADSSSFVTPGVRLHVPLGSRVSCYAAAGGGYGSFDRGHVDINTGIRVEAGRTYHGAFDFGAGMDFRLTRLLSLRGEVRDFVTGKGLGGVRGSNHPLFGFGVAFHF